MISPEVLVPGLRMKLISTSSTKSKLVSHLVGFNKQKKYLIIEQPILGGMPARMDEGMAWTINFIFDGIIYHFTAHVLGSCSRPVNVTFLTYPESLDRTTLRTGKRFPVNIKALCVPSSSRDSEEAKRIQGIIRDISEGGCQFGTTVQFDPGETLDLTMELPDQEPLEDLPAEVVSSRNIGGDRYLYGLSFRPSFTSESYQGLRKFIGYLEALPLRV